MKKILIALALVTLPACSEVHVLPSPDAAVPSGDAGELGDAQLADAGAPDAQVGEDAGPPPPVCVNPIVRSTPVDAACSALENALVSARARLGCEPIACPYVGLTEVDTDGRVACIVAIDSITSCAALEDHVVDCAACYFEGSL